MDINLIQAQIENDLAGADSAQALEEVRIKYLGRKGLVAEVFKTENWKVLTMEVLGRKFRLMVGLTAQRNIILTSLRWQTTIPRFKP